VVLAVQPGLLVDEVVMELGALGVEAAVVAAMVPAAVVAAATAVLV